MNEQSNIVGIITPTHDLFHKYIAENAKPDETYTMINNSHQLNGMKFKRVEKGFESEKVSEEIHKTAFSRINFGEPENCKKEYIENVCDNCEFKTFEMVPHPGGDSKATTESYSCEFGHWNDDF